MEKYYRFPAVLPSAVEEDDLIIIAVKGADLTQALQDIRGRVGEQTQILCVLNGIDSEEQVAAVYGWNHVLYSFMRVTIAMRDGAADFDPNWGRLYFGEKKNTIPYSQRVQDVQELMERCQIP